MARGGGRDAVDDQDVHLESAASGREATLWLRGGLELPERSPQRGLVRLRVAGSDRRWQTLADVADRERFDVPEYRHQVPTQDDLERWRGHEHWRRWQQYLVVDPQWFVGLSLALSRPGRILSQVASCCASTSLSLSQ